MASFTGTSGADTLNGTSGADVINGLDGNDTLAGQAGNDVFTGGAGNDTIDGGKGTDTAVFGGNRADYLITVVNGVTTVKALAGSDGTDTIRNVESLRFADQTLSVGTIGSGTDRTASTPTLTVQPATGSEDAGIPLAIAAALADKDGSESLSIRIAGVPSGAKLSAGTDGGNGTWTLSASQLANLKITPPPNADGAFNLTVTATSTEANGGATASKSATLAVKVNGVADAPSLATSGTHGQAATAIALGSHIQAALTDTDGSESLSLWIAGVPSGAKLSAGVDNGNGSWTLTPTQLANLTITPAAGTTGTIALTIGAVSTEDNGTTATVSKPLTVTIDAPAGDSTASTPTLTVQAASGNEDSAIPLNIAAALTDTDGSESLAIRIAGVPAGAKLSAGVDNGNGSWTLTPAQLASLKITPPANADATMNLTVTATATESNGGATASKSAALAVSVKGVADAPTLTVSDTHGPAGTPIALGSHVAAALTDTDGSETLAIKIAGVPAGASLSAGTNNGGGIWTVTPAQLANLTMTVPAGTTTTTTTGTVLTVGAGKQYTTLAAAVAAAHDGDTIQVQAGTYTNDFATINSKISIVGVGGMVHLVATQPIPNGKAILIANTDATLTNIEFSGAQVADGNGAGVRYQGGNLTLNNCYFHDNQEGLLAGDSPTGSIVVKGCEFAKNGVSNPSAAGYGTTHNLYVGQIGSLTVTGSYFHDAAVGHEIKSRALATTIQDSRIVDGPSGTASYSIDLPNGGNALIKNNVIEQGPASQNPLIIAFGEEGSLLANSALQVSGNTILNDLGSSSARAVYNATTVSAAISGNSFFGLTSGQIVTGPATQTGNSFLATEPALDGSHPWPAATGSTATGPIALTITAISTEDNATTASASKPLTVTIDPASGGDTTASTPTLTVQAASGNEDSAIPLNIAAALTDTDGSESLAIRIAGVPTGASLSAGTNNGGGSWTLTAAQLANLKITPPANADATINLTVTAIATESNGGATASKSAALAVTVKGVADAPTLAVSDAAGPAGTAIALGSHIQAALTDTDGSETLAIKIAGVPADASLSAGTNNGGGSWTLTPAQLANLTITPAASATGAIALTVTAVSTEDNGTTASTGKALNVAIDAGSGSSSPPPSQGTSGAILADAVLQPSHAGDIVGVRLENETGTTEASHMVTFGQAFAPGDLPAGAKLVALVNGQQVPVQMDVKATNPDGSVRHAVITVDAPAIAANGAVDIMLARGTPATSGTAIKPADVLSKGYDLSVAVTLHNSDGTTSLKTISAATVLQQAISAGQVETWMNGPLASEFRVSTVVANNLRVTFDIRLDADGKTHTDVIFANDHTFQTVGTASYDVAIKQGGSTVFTDAGIQQYANTTWHHEVTTDTIAQPHVVEDVNYLIKSGAIPAYDTSIGVDGSAIASDLSALAKADTGPLGPALVTQYMPTTGARPDIGPESAWTARFLISQDAGAEQVMMANADAAGSVPWHFRDEATGQPATLANHPDLWIDYRGAGAGSIPTAYAPGGGWQPDGSHVPSLSYVPYLVTGSHYYLDELQSQASWEIAQLVPGYRTIDSANYDAREQAWLLRDIGDAAWITPDANPLKSYLGTQLTSNLNDYVQKYLIDKIAAGEGQLSGHVFANDGAPQNEPWEQDFLALVMGSLEQRGYSAAGTMLDWMVNFTSGRFINGDNGFNPFGGISYKLSIADAATGKLFSTWQQAYQATFGTTALTQFDDAGSATGMTAMARAALAAEITNTQSPDAIEAFGFVVGHQGASLADYQSDPTWAITPRLADGTLLTMANIHVASGSAPANLVGGNQDQLLYGGTGNDTLSGGGKIDLLFGDAGNDTLSGAAGADFLYGGAGNDRLSGGTGNDYLKGNAGSDTFVFGEAGSGHDTVADFQPGTDHLEIKQNLNGNHLLTAADVLASATVDSHGYVVLHLSAQDDVTLLGVDLAHLTAASITMVP
ncbi:MAG: right-handed parallel beta-helix repeat-containing protein [Dongiaceae bacterium]